MKLDIDSIKKGNKSTLDLNFTLDLKTIDYDGGTIKVKTLVDVKGQLYIIDSRLYINLKIKTNLETSCNRCLELFNYPFESNINVELVHEDLLNHKEEEVDEDIIYYQENTVDLSELVREHIIMNIPMKFICSTSCKGLCPNCGMKIKGESCDCNNVSTQSDDEYVDPRLVKLKNFLQQD